MLVERSDELAELSAALRRAATGRGTSLLVTGERGVGITGFLDEVERGATAVPSPAGEPWLVVRGRAVREERELPAALLQQLVQPLLRRLDSASVLDDETPRRTLEAAIGMRRPSEGGASPAMSMLNVLQAIARRTPVLLLVDDVQWCDASSSAVLRFLVRRLASSSICVVLATSTEPAGAPASAWDDCDAAVTLAPLSEAGARAWLLQHAPDLDPVQEHRVVDLARGLPRRLVDLTGAAGHAGLDALLRDPPGAATTLLRAHRTVDGSSPGQRRRLALLGLLSDPVAEPLIEEAVSALSAGAAAEGPHDLRPARPSTWSPAPDLAADPLLRAVAAASSSEDDRRRGRTAWVRVLDAAAAAAVDAPDRADPADHERAVRLEAEARRLDALAHEGAPVGVPAGPVAALQRSARSLRAYDVDRAGVLFELAARRASGALRARALLSAAEQAWVCGRFPASAALVDAALAAEADDDDAGAAGDLHLRGLLGRWSALRALGSGDPALAAEHLSRALRDLAAAAARPGASAPGAAADDAVACAAALVLVAGRGPSVATAVRQAASGLPGASAEVLQTLAGLAQPWRDAVPADQHRAFDVLLQVLDASSLPLHRWAADLAWALDRTDDVRTACERRLAHGTTSGPLAVDLHLALYACSIEASRARAEEHLLGAESAARRVGRHAPALALAVRQARARTSTMNGDADAELPGPTLVTTETAGAVRAAAQRHHALGEVEAAVAALQQLWPQPSTAHGGDAVPGALMSSVLFFTSLRQAEHPPAEVARHLRPVTDWARGSGALTAAAVDLQCSALAEPDDARALGLAEQTVDVTRTMATSNSTALAELVLGMRLRRLRRAVAAREPLRRATRMFEHTGNAYLVHISRREYEATAPSRPQRSIGSKDLTSQERTVAQLAAQGLGNAEIASHLGISTRTVAHHLQRVYSKLRVQGRTQLTGQAALR